MVMYIYIYKWIPLDIYQIISDKYKQHLQIQAQGPPAVFLKELWLLEECHLVADKHKELTLIREDIYSFMTGNICFCSDNAALLGVWWEKPTFEAIAEVLMRYISQSVSS